MTRPRNRAATVLVAVLLAVPACGDDDPDAVDDTATTVSTVADATTASAADTTTTTTEPPADEGTVIEISVVGDEVTGGGRHQVPLGETVVLRVTSDAADEVHLHGYDLSLDLPPGQPAVLRFDATIPGVFEAELHDAGIVLAELQIQ